MRTVGGDKLDTSLTWLDVLAVLIDVGAAGLGQQDVVPEVVHLHLLKVEDLVLALLPPQIPSQVLRQQRF